MVSTSGFDPDGWGSNPYWSTISFVELAGLEPASIQEMRKLSTYLSIP